MSNGFKPSEKGLAELKNRVLFTLFMLAVFRLGIYITSPGVDREVLSKIINTIPMFGLVNMFSGGALEQLSIFALGVMPYISSSIIFQILPVIVPSLQKMQKEGGQGKQKIQQYSRYGSIVISIIQGLSIATYLETLKSPAGEAVVSNPGLMFKFTTVITLTAGTTFVMWLGEQISEKGIGNGVSLIIFTGIVAGLPEAMVTSYDLVGRGQIEFITFVLLVILMVGVIAFVIFFERGQRRIQIQYHKRQVGNKMMGQQSIYLPLKVNVSGVIPPIFASSILMFPATISSFLGGEWSARINNLLDPSSWIYNAVYVVMIIFFCYFYTAIVFNPEEVAENIKKNGGSIPGVRQGKQTSDYIDTILTKITLGGAIYMSIVCIIPTLLIARYNVPFYFGGTALLIVVAVALDTVSQMQTYLIEQQYDGFMAKGPRVRGRRAT